MDQLYYLLKKIITENLNRIDGKICLPISGGLDSRIVAGFLKLLNVPIDLVITYGNPGDKHLVYTQQIAKIVRYNKPVIQVYATREEIEANRKTVQKLNGLAGMSTPTFVCLSKINQLINLKEYTFLIPYMIDVMTGIKINAMTIWKGKEYFQEFDQFMVSKYYQNICEKGLTIYRYFGKDAINPVWKSQELIDYCLSLPLRYRFHQYLYRKMLRNYFPELAEIPRAYMDCKMTCNEITYFIYRTLYFLKKIKYEKNHQIRY